MAAGKGRNKRLSGNSYASTATTLLFVALCIFGVWMLNPNSLFSPATTTTTTRTAFSHSHSFPTTVTKRTTSFQDNPSDRPDDDVKTDQDDDKDNASADDSSNNNDEKQDLVDKQELEPGITRTESDNVNIIKEPKEEIIKQPVEDNSEGLHGKVSEEEQQKLNEHEIQLSEESTMTHNQVDQETKVDHDRSKSIEKTFEAMEGADQQVEDEKQTSDSKNDEDDNKMDEENQKSSIVDDPLVKEDSESKVQEDPNESQSESLQNSKDGSNLVSDEENERRMEQQQQQEEEQVKQNHPRGRGGEEEEEQKTQREETDGEGTNNDQIQHDEEPLDNTTEEENVQQTEQQDQNLQTDENDNARKPRQGKKKRKKQQQQSTSDSGDNSFPSGDSSGIPKESKESKKAWSTQADQSENQKERRTGSLADDQDDSIYGYSWQLCNVTAGADYIPCLDNEKAIRKLRSRKHFEHRERHCPEEPPSCLVPLPQGYKRPVEWPHSRDKIWYHNVPHLLLAEVKGHQNWVKLTGEFLTFPGGGTQFIHGALHYIDFIQEAVPDIAWGKRTRTVLDVGCGVASFGGYLFERDVLTISFAPKDEHEAQVQFALERGIPAISAVMGSQRLPFPSKVFDTIHCSRCRVHWHVEGGALLLELNRMLRPGGYFVWSATPVYQKLEEDVEIWKATSALTVSMCWELVTIKKDKLNMVGAAIYRKPETNECYEERNNKNPPMCKRDDDPNAAWYVPLQSCMHRVPVDTTERGSQRPQEWPRRLQAAPYWLNRSQMGIYGKPAPDDFVADSEHWQRVVSKSYLSGLGSSWSNVRNIMDMRAVYGGFAAALKDLNVWVLNVVNIDSPDTLPIIYERGLFGIYHDWCESFSTYPRTYDLLHADHLFSILKKRCKIAPLMAEIDRIVRPGGKLIVRDESSAVGEVENLLKSLHWEIHLTFSKNREGILSAQKSDWRPESYAAPS